MIVAIIGNLIIAFLPLDAFSSINFIAAIFGICIIIDEWKRL